MIRPIFFLAIAAAFLSGCGYTTGSMLPSNYRTIAIEPFKNSIAYLNENVRTLYVPLLEVKAHDAIVSRFEIDGHLKISRSDRATLILKGELIAFDREEVRLIDADNVEQYRLRITVSLVLIDPASGEELWREPGFAGEATYYTSGPLAKSEDTAMQETLTDLSRRVVERTLENW